MIGNRIKQIRLARGFTLEQLSALLGGLVTKQAISKYERGDIKPSNVVLFKIAEVLRVQPSYIWGEPQINVKIIEYRKRMGLKKREQEYIENYVKHNLEERVMLQWVYPDEAKTDIPLNQFDIDEYKDVEDAANDLRGKWGLGIEPISNITDSLEKHGVHVIELNNIEDFDGVSAIAYEGDQIKGVAVVSRNDIAGERQRFNLAHELGHLVLDVSPKIDREKAVYRFGGAFMAPQSVLRQEIGNKRTSLQIEELLLLKRRFGISIQALLYRMRDLEIINESHYKKWCIEINRMHWRKQEPLEMRPELSTWLEGKILRAVSEGILPQKEAETMLNKKIGVTQPLITVKRRDLLKLPLEERRRILAEQAQRMVQLYNENTEWKDLQGEDIVEY